MRLRIISLFLCCSSMTAFSEEASGEVADPALQPKKQTSIEGKPALKYSDGCWVCSPHDHYAIDPSGIDSITKANKCTTWRFVPLNSMKQSEVNKFLEALNERKKMDQKHD